MTSWQTQPPVPPDEDSCDLLRASGELFQGRLTEIVKQSGISLPSALAAFGRELGEAHDQLASAGPLDGFDQIGELTASRLTLLGDEDLELDIRLREIGTHLREAVGRDLWRARSRYMTLLHRPTIEEAADPIGFEVICLGLRALCREFGGSLEQRLTLLDRLERSLGEELPRLYREIDGLLTRGGVEAAVAANAVGMPTRRGPGNETPDRRGEVPTNPLSALRQVVRQRSAAESPAETGDSAAESPARSGNPTLDAAAMLMLQHLLERLSVLEACSTARATDSTETDSLPRQDLRALKSKDLDLPLGIPEAITLDTLALIFEAIFDSTELPDAVKAAIARLQIPLLKLAIIDPSLFANSQHPARMLINRMARAAVGLPRQAGREHPVCQRLAALSAAVRETLSANSGGLDPYLAELGSLIDARDREVRLAGEAYALLLATHETRQHAEQLARDWLRTSLARNRSPEIASFLDRYWLRVMITAALEGGSEGKRWQEDSATGEDLIWSVLPKETAEERKRLAGQASSLVRRIGAGLDAIGVSAAERAPFLNCLFDLQTAALRGQPAIPSGASDNRTLTGSSATASPKQGPRLLTGSGMRIHYLVTANTRTHQGASSSWQVGDWLRFRASEQEAVCGLCCWRNPASGTVLLFNPDWGYAVAIAPSTLDEQIAAKRAQVVSRIATFDAAAERALQSLDAQ
ncbi:DUF1631 family protein [Accumulibacter sp.]|uniref:DUF1631 family protein n=1 Tax=Accumulibacter sp. TaxID=2053492 RepID=UPI0026348782|nr:DUF1631 family protein [Accumulibacter sp.]